MPRNEKSYISSEITYVGKVLDQEEKTGFKSTASTSGVGWMPRTLSETIAEVQSQLRGNRCLDPSAKFGLGAGKLHATT